MKKAWIIVAVIAILGAACIGYEYYKLDKDQNESINNLKESSKNIVESNSTDNGSEEVKGSSDKSLDNDEIKNRLLGVMKSNEKFLNEDNTEVLFKDFKIIEQEKAVPDKYAFVDLDKDGKDELVVLTTSDYGAYIILKEINNKVYGYMLGIRSMEQLKKDGSFVASSGAKYNDYCTIKFNENKYTIEKEATYNESNDEYIVENREISQQKFEGFTQEWDKKEDVSWIKYGA